MLDRNETLEDKESCLNLIAGAYNALKKENTAVVIGIDGLDCTGKSTFAKILYDRLSRSGVSVCLVDIDDYNDPSIEAATYEAFSKDEFTEKHLDIYYEKIIDFKSAKKEILKLKDKYSAVVVEGIFIYKQELYNIFDLTIFLRANVAIARERYRMRRNKNHDKRPIEIFDKIWVPAHDRYVEETDPYRTADIVIEYSDFQYPKITKHVRK